jgi:cell division protein FtsZ
MTAEIAKKANALKDIRPRITVIGIGGAGNNAVNNMIRANLQGVQYLACNTDAQHLAQCLVESERRLQLGLEVTQGLGAGSRPEVGRAAAEESLEEIRSFLEGTNMVFVTAGMGGGTGTGATPVISQAAREMGILTVGVVTKPFHFEGPHRMKTAEAGIKEMEQFVDTLIIIPNQNLFRVANEKTTFAEAFKMADNVLYSGVRGVTDLMIMPGLINLDFADIRAVMTEMGKAMMGTGEATGEGRAIAAAEAAIANPLLDDVTMRGAKGVLINITGGLDMTLFEVDEAANRIREEVDTDNTINTNIIFGSTFDEKMEGSMRVSVVATGIDAEEIKRRVSEAAHKKQEQDDKVTIPTLDSLQKDHFDTALLGVNELEAETDEGVEILKLDSVHMIDRNLEESNFERAANDDELMDKHQEETEHNHPEKKKGFFSRFFDTIAGHSEEEQTAFRVRPTSTRAHVNESLTLDVELEEAEMHDVPAFLRRKKKH